jgi:hypothetical protein
MSVPWRWLKMDWVLTLCLPTGCLESCNKPFSAFTIPLYWCLGADGQTWQVESQEFGPWVQNSGFNFSLLAHIQKSRSRLLFSTDEQFCAFYAANYHYLTESHILALFSNYQSVPLSLTSMQHSGSWFLELKKLQVLYKWSTGISMQPSRQTSHL